MKGHPTPPRGFASGELPIVYIIDDDESVRGALTNLFHSVSLRSELSPALGHHLVLNAMRSPL